jgi:hypothetical protein
MSTTRSEQRFVERLVSYTLEIEGRFVVIEHVPARVDEETGERFFDPATVERLQQIVWSGDRPSRTIEMPVYEFAA